MKEKSLEEELAINYRPHARVPQVWPWDLIIAALVSALAILAVQAWL